MGWWTFDGKDVNATQVLDKAGTNNGTRTGGVAVAKGKIGQAGKFDGVNDYVDMGNAGSTLTDNFTLTAWIKGDVTSDGLTILSRRATATQWHFYTTVKKLGFYTGAAAYTSAVSSLTDNAWYFVAVKINGANSAFYINGVQSGSSFSPTITAQTLNTQVGILTAYLLLGKVYLTTSAFTIALCRPAR